MLHDVTVFRPIRGTSLNNLGAASFCGGWLCIPFLIPKFWPLRGLEIISEWRTEPQTDTESTYCQALLSEVKAYTDQNLSKLKTSWAWQKIFLHTSLQGGQFPSDSSQQSSEIDPFLESALDKILFKKCLCHSICYIALKGPRTICSDNPSHRFVNQFTCLHY